jgi:hypothetical protein
MSKGSDSARRQDLWILRTVAKITHLEAVRRLDGARGADVAHDASEIVRRVRETARERQAETGERYSIALAKVLEQPKYLATETSFPVVQLVALDWSLLYGVHVEFNREAGEAVQSMRGVVLPPVAGPRSRPRLRVALTSGSLGSGPGDVVTVEVRRWRLNPEPAQIAADRSRRTRCGAGRPVYGVTDVPGPVLATMGTLRRRWLRPAILQAPVATQRTDNGRITPLYAIADAEPVPVSSQRQAAAIQRRRTCAECGATATEPFRRARDGERYCDVHFHAAEQRIAKAEQARHRAVSVVWARDVFNDEATVLAALIRNPGGDRLQIRVEDVAGAVLFAQELRSSQIPSAIEVAIGMASQDALPSWAFQSGARIVLDRRTLLAATDGAGNEYAELLGAAGALDPFRARRISSNREDNLRVRYGLWQGKVTSRDLENRFASSMLLVDWFSRADRSGERDVVEVLADMRAALVEMVSTDIPPDQLEHAELLYSAKPKYVWFSQRRHDQARMGKDLMRLFDEGR